VSRPSEGGTVSEVEDQRGDGEIGTCHVCGRTFPTQEELSKHPMDDHDGELLVDPGSDEQGKHQAPSVPTPSGGTNPVPDDSTSGEDGSGAGHGGITS
jgi:hypothetical protein